MSSEYKLKAVGLGDC